MFAIVMASAAIAAAPASAQMWKPQPSVQRQIQADINQLERQVQRAQQRRTISPREATSLRRDALNVQRLYNRYSRNGLDRREVADLEGQTNRLRQRLRLERRDWDGRRG
jgi:type II secretory pathway predicted ATPase ExeA